MLTLLGFHKLCEFLFTLTVERITFGIHSKSNVRLSTSRRDLMVPKLLRILTSSAIFTNE